MTSLPPLLVLTDRSQCSRPLPEVVASAVEHGARAVVLREKDLPDDRRDALASSLRTVLEPVGGVLVRAGAPRPEDAGAVHLSAQDAFPSPRPRVVGRSCHSAAELAQARDEGCDYVFLSPVFHTASKPGYGPPLGIDVFGRLVDGAPPVYALGGVLPEHVPDLLAAGAAGIAVMGPVMRDPALASAYRSALGDHGSPPF